MLYRDHERKVEKIFFEDLDQLEMVIEIESKDILELNENIDH